MSESVKEIRERVEEIRETLEDIAYIDAAEGAWLVSQLTRALDRNEELASENTVLRGTLELARGEGSELDTAALDASDTDAGTARPASHVPSSARRRGKP